MERRVGCRRHYKTIAAHVSIINDMQLQRDVYCRFHIESQHQGCPGSSSKSAAWWMLALSCGSSVVFGMGLMIRLGRKCSLVFNKSVFHLRKYRFY